MRHYFAIFAVLDDHRDTTLENNAYLCGIELKSRLIAQRFNLKVLKYSYKNGKYA